MCLALNDILSAWRFVSHKMVCFSSIICAFSAFLVVNGQLQPALPAEYKRLPSLREQAAIQDQWRAERMSRVPALLKKYGVDAWLVLNSSLHHSPHLMNV